mmetsp:Transcript_112113/g.241747  ORF Transcript_112113/g.241747 Transcript_112113/m.241747 type:complete len:105 (-) Transcript_112113:290-604(-)
MAKELIEDVARFLRDKEINNSKYLRFNLHSKKWDEITSSQIHVGDIIQAKDRVPADCIILTTLNEEGNCFIKTDQLDGETDWKQRRSVKCTFDQLKSEEGRNWF